MATVYEVEVVSHWISYTEKDLQKIIEDAIKEKEKEKSNEIKITVKSRN